MLLLFMVTSQTVNTGKLNTAHFARGFYLRPMLHSLKRWGDTVASYYEELSGGILKRRPVYFYD